MELRQLRTFAAVARELSFTRAAAELDYVQSAVTAQVKALEEELGVRLFDRLPRRVVLTDAGRNLLGYAVRVLDLSEEARATVSRRDGHGVGGTLEVGASETLCVYRLPDVFRAFRSRFPGVDLRFHPVPYARLKELVKEGSLDVAFLLEEPLGDEYLVAETLIREPLVLVAPPDHALSKRSRVSLTDLGGEPMLLTDRGCSYRRAFEREMAKAGRAVTVLPRVATLAEIEEGSLIARPLIDDELEQSTLSLIHRLGRQLDGAPARLLAILEAKLRTWADEVRPT